MSIDMPPRLSVLAGRACEALVTDMAKESQPRKRPGGTGSALAAW
jgi:hypothetical protein